MLDNKHLINTFWPSDAIPWHRSGSTLAQVTMTPSHYLNQSWLIISKVSWHSSENIIIRSSEDKVIFNFLKSHPDDPGTNDLKILFTQYTCASLWWQLVLNTATLWMQLTLKAAVAKHVLDVFTGWFTPSTGLARVLQIICQKSHNLVRLSDEYILCCDLDYENFDLDPERVIKYNTRGLLPPWINFNPSMDK